MLSLIDRVQLLIFGPLKGGVVSHKLIFSPRILFDRYKLRGVLQIESLVLLLLRFLILKFKVLTTRGKKVRTVIDIDEI